MRDAETLTMSAKELDRLEIIGRVVERRLTQRTAADRLGLSLRHVDGLSDGMARLGWCRASVGIRVTGSWPCASKPWICGRLIAGHCQPDISTLHRTRPFYFMLTLTGETPPVGGAFARPESPLTAI